HRHAQPGMRGRARAVLDRQGAVGAVLVVLLGLPVAADLAGGALLPAPRGADPGIAEPRRGGNHVSRVRSSSVAAVALGLFLDLALALGLLPPPPGGLRLALAFGSVVLLPGYAWVRLTALPPGGWWLSPSWALGLGVMWNALLVLATRVLGLRFTVL